MKVKRITVFEVRCPECDRKIKTEKQNDVQCRECGTRFDIE